MLIHRPDNAVIALATQRPTVIVKDGLMLEAFTMSALSPVARMERPNLVFKNADKITPITSTINAATISYTSHTRHFLPW